MKCPLKRDYRMQRSQLLLPFRGVDDALLCVYDELSKWTDNAVLGIAVPDTPEAGSPV